MKLTQLLALHQEAPDTNGLLKNLGDGYLLHHNPIYAHIRSRALAAGYSYSCEMNSDYLALPLIHLDQLMDSKILPYVDNVTVLGQLIKKAGPTVTWNDISDNLRRNQIFHESCHAVARDSTSFRRLHSQVQDPREIVLDVLLEESYANACEFLAVAFASNQEHRIFIELNSYTSLFEETRDLQKLVAEFGRERMLLFLSLSYLQSNGLQPTLSKNLFHRICEMSLKEANSVNFRKFEKLLFHMAQQTMTLDERFRTLVTPLYLKLNNCPWTARQIAETDWLSFLEKSDRRFTALQQLTSDFH